MYFECLVNELILEIFKRLDVIYLIRAFDGLNSRLNQLLRQQLPSYNLDFRSVSKQDFEHLCCRTLPWISGQITSIHLSDHEETPNLPRLFLSSHLSITQFVHLQSLSLYSIQSVEILNQLIIQCHRLPSLTHLHLIQQYLNYSDNDVQCLMNNIWSLSKLTHYTLNQITSRKIPLTQLSVISSTIKYLTLEKITCDFQDLFHLFTHTPCLRRIAIQLIYGFPSEQLPTPVLSLTSLKISYHGRMGILTNLFRYTPNLIRLILETSDMYCDGYQWETILTDYLPQVKIFRLKMNWNFVHHHPINEQIDELLETFRTCFWIEEHQWFVRCDWNPWNTFSNNILYTLPYAFDDCFYFDAISSKSTCPNHREYCSYDCVSILSYVNPRIDSILFSARFPNIHHLKIHFPFNENFWPCLSSLDRLTSIDVTLLQHTDSAYVQLQKLLNSARHLYALNLSYSKDVPMRLFAMTSGSIRRLDFLTKNKSSVHYFDKNECDVLIHSPLVRQQCEVLLIAVKTRSIIVSLTKALSTLRSLTCQCEDDEYDTWSSSITNDELVEWLQKCLPVSYSISRNENQTNLIRLWMN